MAAELFFIMPALQLFVILFSLHFINRLLRPCFAYLFHQSDLFAKVLGYLFAVLIRLGMVCQQPVGACLEIEVVGVVDAPRQFVDIERNGVSLPHSRIQFCKIQVVTGPFGAVGRQHERTAETAFRLLILFDFHVGNAQVLSEEALQGCIGGRFRQLQSFMKSGESATTKYRERFIFVK